LQIELEFRLKWKERIMNIVLFGASGTIGQRILREALERGHSVTAIVRQPEQIAVTHPNLTVKAGDVLDSAFVAQAVAGFDAVISAVGPKGQQPSMLSESAHSLIEGLTRAGVKRLIVVGGAGSLEAAPGTLVYDTPDFPAAWRPGAMAHGEGLKVYRSADLDWTYFSPAYFIQPGERTGKYRVGFEQLLRDEGGKSFISAEDFGVAILDELEAGWYVRRRVTIAY
jgi:uncharacterized protein